MPRTFFQTQHITFYIQLTPTPALHNRPQSDINPKQEDYQRIIASFLFFPAFLSSILLPFAFRHNLLCLQHTFRNLLEATTNKN